MRLKIGEVLKPQGIKGEIKVRSLFDTPEEFSGISSIYVGENSYKIKAVRVREGFVYLTLDGIIDINSAETLRGKTIEILRSDAPQLPEGRFYIDDLLGLDIIVDGQKIGVLNQVLQYGSADIYSVKGDKNLMFPALKKVIKSVDLSAKQIVLDGVEFQKVAVYEN